MKIKALALSNMIKMICGDYFEFADGKVKPHIQDVLKSYP